MTPTPPPLPRWTGGPRRFPWGTLLVAFGLLMVLLVGTGIALYAHARWQQARDLRQWQAALEDEDSDPESLAQGMTFGMAIWGALGLRTAEELHLANAFGQALRILDEDPPRPLEIQRILAIWCIPSEPMAPTMAVSNHPPTAVPVIP